MKRMITSVLVPVIGQHNRLWTIVNWVLGEVGQSLHSQLKRVN